MSKEKVKGYLNDKDPEKIAYIAKNFSKFQKIYNLLCRKCTAKVQRERDVPISGYCDTCRSKAEKILG